MPLNLTADQQDALCEVVNVGVGRAAASLSDLIGSRIVLTVPSVTLYDVTELRQRATLTQGGLSTAVVQSFKGPIHGRAVLVFPRDSGRKLGQLLGGLDALPDDNDPDLCGILTEVGNIVLNGVLGALANTLHAQLSYTVPQCSSDRVLPELIDSFLAPTVNQSAAVLVTATNFHVAQQSIEGSLLIGLERESIERVLETLQAMVLSA